MLRLPRIGPALVISGLVVASLFASTPGAGGASSSTATVTSTVLSSTSFASSGCEELDFGLVPVLTTVMTASCSVSFASSNNSAALRTSQLDRTGVAMERRGGSAARSGVGVIRGIDQSSDGLRGWQVGSPLITTDPAIIRVTVDDGLTWTPQTPCVGMTYARDLSVVSSTVAVVVGTGSTSGICRTTDGGVTWVNIAAGAGFIYYDIDRAADGTLWTIGQYGTRILRSVDDGATWNSVPLAAGNSVNEVLAVSSSTAVVTGYVNTGISDREFESWRTTNSGATWTRSLMDTLTTRLYVQVGIDRSVSGKIIVSTSATGTYSYQSLDGGVTWSPGTVPGWGVSMRHVGGNKWIVGRYANSTTYRSIDDGVTWSSIVVNTSGSGSTTYAVSKQVGSTIMIGGSYEGVDRSADGGFTWSDVSVPVNDYYAVTGAGARRFVAVGVGGVVRISSNWGAALAYGVSGTTSTLRDVERVVDDRVVAVGDGGVIIVSDDGGATWGARTCGVATSLRALARAENLGAIYAAGDGGVICRSYDNGDTWSQIGAPSAANITGIAVQRDGQFIWVNGVGNGIIQRSSDQGATWSAQATGQTVPVVRLSSNGYGIVIANPVVKNQSVFRSADSGVTWAVVPGVASSIAEVIDVAFSNRDRVWLVRRDNYTWESSDGGATFTSNWADGGARSIYRAVGHDGNQHIVSVGGGDKIVTIGTLTPTTVPDFNGTTATLTSATGAFGACASTSSANGAVGWTPAGGACNPATLGHWHPIPATFADPEATIARTLLGATGTVGLVFGMRVSSTQTPGAYIAHLQFEVIAP